MPLIPRFFSVCLALTTFFAISELASAETKQDSLATSLQPFLSCLSGAEREFALEGEVRLPIDGSQQQVTFRLQKFSDAAFDLTLTHADYAVELRRRADATAFALPLHNVVFMGTGECDPQDHLGNGVVTRMLERETQVKDYAPLVLKNDAAAAIKLLNVFVKLEYDAESQTWNAGKNATFGIKKDALWVKADDVEVELRRLTDLPARKPADAWPAEMRLVKLPRAETERQLARGVGRALEILAPSENLILPKRTNRKTASGELRWIEGERVAILRGTPEQIGTAHGQLLAAESQRCIDSVLYTFGTAQTIRTGRWFRQDLDAAYKRLAPHIPEDHKRKAHALATASGKPPELVAAVNVFPELFHCSGFAVFGKATKDGKLYHGRVLDYMTTIGLQDSATTFIVAVDGKIPFANVGYGGFIGSVSGMNAEAISLGEMGGRGEGQWDGAPMATLMRRALEECSTLKEVKQLWTDSPRTCEYYYVFADGKTNEAVGAGATPEKIEFVNPGEGHPLLGEGIADTVVLSAGSRLEKLRERITEKHGEIDVEVAKWLMSRPVAMSSNLHNVLFVPADGVLYVANADHRKPAAERPYVKLDLKGLLEGP